MVVVRETQVVSVALKLNFKRDIAREMERETERERRGREIEVFRKEEDV